MPLESLADRKALLEIDAVAVRVYPGGVASPRRAQFDGSSRAVQTGFEGPEVIETAPSLYMLATDVAGVTHGTRVEVLEGPGAGDYVAVRVSKQDDGAFVRVDLADRA